MDTRDTSGPAFPVIEFDASGAIYAQHFGLTKREYFACEAMKALIQAPLHEWPESDDGESVSKAAYLMADAMLKERA